MDKLLAIGENGQPVASSRDIAEHFGKRHDHVLRDIDAIKEDVPNFGEMFFSVTVPDSYGRPQRAYAMNRDGFTLLAMGFTGKEALEWKLRYIEAFNQMEADLKSQQKPLSGAEQLLAQAQYLVEQERRLKAVEAKQERFDNAVAVMSAPLMESDGWQERAQKAINTAVERYDLNHQTFRADLYEEVERRAHVDLGSRQARMRNRMKANGATTNECKAVTKLHVIARDAKLRVIFETVLRQRVIRMDAERSPQ